MDFVQNENKNSKKEKKEEIVQPKWSEVEVKESNTPELKGDNFFAWVGGFFKKEKENKFLSRKEAALEYSKIANKDKKENDVVKDESVSSQTVVEENSTKKEEKKKVKKSKWKAASILETNLIENEETIFVNWEGYVKTVFYNLFFIFIIIFFVYGGLMIWEQDINSKNKIMEQEIKNIEAQQRQVVQKINEASGLVRKIAVAKKLLENHIYWTNFFRYMEENTLTDLQIDGGAIDYTLDGNFNLTMFAKGSRDASGEKFFYNISDQVKVFRDSDMIIDAKVGSGEIDFEEKKGENEDDDPIIKKELKFEIELVMDSKIFYKNKTE